MNEYLLINGVQYSPTSDRVDIMCFHNVISSAGNKIQQHRSFVTTQPQLEALMPEGKQTWGDEEVIAWVEAETQITCVLQEPVVEE